MLPEEKARIKIDKQLIDAGWDIVAGEDYIPNYTLAVFADLNKIIESIMSAIMISF